MKVLVTGATGFLGSHLLLPLQKIAAVRALLRPKHFEKINILKEKGVETIEGDIENPASLGKAVDGVDAVIHCAALMSNFETEPYKKFFSTNVLGTKNILASLRGVNENCFLLHISTVNVLGPCANAPLDETSAYSQSRAKYSRSKIEAEKLVRANTQTPWIILRPAQLYGEGMTYGWPQTLQKIQQGRFFIPGDGKARLHLTHVSDIVNGILLALNQRTQAKGQIFHLAGPSAPPLRAVFDYLAALLKVRPPQSIPYAAVAAAAYLSLIIPQRLKPESLRLLHPKMLDYFVNDYIYDTTKAREILGYNPTIDYETGLKKLVNWHLN